MIKNNKSIIALTLLIIVVVAMVFVVFPKINATKEAERIKETINVTNQFYNEHDLILGLGPINNDTSQVCYYVGGKFEKGDLWCDYEINKIITVEDNPDAIQSKITSIKSKINEQGFEVTDEGKISLGAGIYDNQKQKDGKSCRIVIDYSNKPKTDIDSTELNYSLLCSLELSKIPYGFMVSD